MTNDPTLQPGALLRLSEGEYDDYTVVALVRVEKPFRAEDVLEEFRQAHPDKDDGGGSCGGPKGFVAWLVEVGYVKLLPVMEWWIGSYGEFDPDGPNVRSIKWEPTE